MLKNKNYSLL